MDRLLETHMTVRVGSSWPYACDILQHRSEIFQQNHTSKRIDDKLKLCDNYELAYIIVVVVPNLCIRCGQEVRFIKIC